MKTQRYVVRVLILQSGADESICVLTKPGSKWIGRCLGTFLIPYRMHHPIDRQWRSSTPQAAAQKAYRGLKGVSLGGIPSIRLHPAVPVSYCSNPVIAEAR